MTDFSELGLHERLLRALEHLALSTPTPVQEAMIPLAMTGADIQASAETGSGKTAAYVLPILHRMLENPSPATAATRALILLPTRELALQVEKHTRDLAGYTLITTGVVVGGTPYGEQKAMIRKNPEILVGTPGRILEHVNKNSIELKDLEYLVLDEADRMLDMGFRDEVLNLVKACPPKRQTYLLSATLVHDGIGRISDAVLSNPEVVAIGTHRSHHANIAQQRILADDPGHKKQLSNWLLANTEYDKALVFTNTRDHAEELSAFLQSQRDGKGKSKVWETAGKGRSRVACLHGEMLQEDRRKVMHWFRTGVIKVLVSTDLAARGLDVKGVDLVLNFAMPRSGDDYVHRIGRTGRAGVKGLAISLVAPQEWNQMESIERYLAITLEPKTIPGLESRFKGPSKKSASAAKKKADTKPKPKTKVIPKAQQRHSFIKNIGKRRVPRAAGSGEPGLQEITQKVSVSPARPVPAAPRSPAKDTPNPLPGNPAYQGKVKSRQAGSTAERESGRVESGDAPFRANKGSGGKAGTGKRTGTGGAAGTGTGRSAGAGKSAEAGSSKATSVYKKPGSAPRRANGSGAKPKGLGELEGKGMAPLKRKP